MMPSQRKILANLLIGRIERIIGCITVGPVTTTNAPNSDAISQRQSIIKCVATLMVIQVTTIPMLTRLVTIRPWPRISSNLSVSLPSKSITATARKPQGITNDRITDRVAANLT